MKNMMEADTLMEFAGETIPLGSRILGVVDAYTTTIGGLNIKIEFLNKQALKELVRCKGTQFDPEIILNDG